MSSTKRSGGKVSRLPKSAPREYSITIDDNDIRELQEHIEFLQEEQRKARFKRVTRGAQRGIDLAKRLLRKAEQKGRSGEENGDPDSVA